MKYYRMTKLNMVILCLLFCLSVCGLAGCGSNDSSTKVVLTTGLGSDEVFRIENQSAGKAEMMVYLTNMQNQYENVYGSEIWDTVVDGKSLEESVKDNALAKMAQVKTMNLMAQEMGITLSTQEIKQVENTGDIYYDSLNNTEIDAMGITRDTIYNLYREYMIAQKAYQEIIKDINPEVSDDEARNITIEYILIKTYSQDGTGKKIEYTDNVRESARARAEEAHEKAVNGEDFDSLVAEYSEVNEMVTSLGTEDIESDYVRTILFDLANDEISEVMTTEDGYLIAKCLSTYDPEETDANKVTIVEQEKEAVFGEKYDEYVVNLTRMLNDDLWSRITFVHDPEVTTSDFFTIADEHLFQGSIG